MISPTLPVIVTPDPAPELPLQRPPACANCGAMLSGTYCAACGQRHEAHVHTLSHFMAEAIEGITHADSRLWRTLGYLLARPGMLTCEFLGGRRASYLPPFRLYLVISLVFFLVGAPGHVSVKRQSLGDAADSAASGLAKPQDAEHKVSISFGGLDVLCKSLEDPAASTGILRKQLRERCGRLSAGDGSSLGEVVVHNVPRAMFAFLPLLALVMKALYWRQRRYYVEHLLFLIHNHACIFLTATLLILFSRLPYTDPFMGWLWSAAAIYAVWYLYRAMRKVYGQARGITLAKYLTLGTSYVATSVMMLTLTVVYSALTL